MVTVSRYHGGQDQHLLSEVLPLAGCFCSNPHALDHERPQGEKNG